MARLSIGPIGRATSCRYFSIRESAMFGMRSLNACSLNMAKSSLTNIDSKYLKAATGRTSVKNPALTELFEEAKNGDTPIMVERIVNDIDEIVRHVRFDGWQDTHAGEREIKKALRKTLFKYKLHQDTDLIDRAYGYIKENY